MRILRQVLGIIGVIFGGLGVLLAIALLIGVWIANPALTQRLQALTDALQARLLAAEQVVMQSIELVEELSTRLAARPEDVPPLLERLDASISRVQSTLVYADQTIQTVQAMTDAAGRLPLPGRNQEPTAVGGKLDQAAQAVDGASQKLGELEGLSAALAQRNGLTLDQLTERLAGVQSTLSTLAARLSEVQAQLAQLEVDIPGWVNWSTVALTVLALWSGIAQLGLLILSWRWVRQPGNGTTSTA